jgi:hypothetical protein
LFAYNFTVPVPEESVPQRIQELQIQHFFKADPAYGEGVAKGLGLEIAEIVGSEKEVVSTRYDRSKRSLRVGCRLTLFLRHALPRLETVQRFDRSRACVQCRRILLSSQPLTNEK